MKQSAPASALATSRCKAALSLPSGLPTASRALAAAMNAGLVRWRCCGCRSGRPEGVPQPRKPGRTGQQPWQHSARQAQSTRHMLQGSGCRTYMLKQARVHSSAWMEHNAVSCVPPQLKTNIPTFLQHPRSPAFHASKAQLCTPSTSRCFTKAATASSTPSSTSSRALRLPAASVAPLPLLQVAVLSCACGASHSLSNNRVRSLQTLGPSSCTQAGSAAPIMQELRCRTSNLSKLLLQLRCYHICPVDEAFLNSLEQASCRCRPCQGF